MYYFLNRLQPINRPVMDVKYLPPANEVWGKVMFYTPVCHSVHRGVSVPAYITGHMTGVSLSRRGCLCPGGGLCPGGSLSRGVWLQEVSVGRVIVQWGLCLGGLCQGDLPERDPCTVMSGRYASYWMHFCFMIILGSPTHLNIRQRNDVI